MINYSLNKLLEANKFPFLDPEQNIFIHKISTNDGNSFMKDSHRTNFYGVTFLEKGNMQMTINERSFTFKNNSIALTAPGQVISIFCDTKEDSSGYVLFFLEDFLSSVKPSQKIENEFSFFNLDANAMFALENDLKLIKSVFEIIYDEFTKKDIIINKLIDSFIITLLKVINRNYLISSEQNLNKNKNARYYELTNKFESIVQKNLPKKTSITSIAQQLLVSKKHLNEIIKKTRGTTTIQYINSIHMLEAKKLLVHTSLSINEIAYQLDFEDPSYFNKVFKFHFKLTPTEYRKMMVR